MNSASMPVTITEQDIESLALKLAQFTRELTTAERAAFELVEQRLVDVVTSRETADVLGYDFGSVDTMLADARRADLLRSARADTKRTGDNGSLWQTLLELIAAGRHLG